MSVKLLSAHMCSLVFFGVDPQVHQATAIMKWSKSESSGMDAFDRMDLAVRERKKERKKERKRGHGLFCVHLRAGAEP